MSFQTAPELMTARLRLRAYRAGDFEAFAAYFASPRSQYTDGPIDRSHAWDLFCAGAGRWPLCGYGAWCVEILESGEAAGLVSLNTPISQNDLELGWILYDGFEGQGIAYEAAACAREFAFAQLKWTSLISGIHEENERSIRLAHKLGAIRDETIRDPEEPETLFFRHVYAASASSNSADR